MEFGANMSEASVAILRPFNVANDFIIRYVSSPAGAYIMVMQLTCNKRERNLDELESIQ